MIIFIRKQHLKATPEHSQTSGPSKLSGSISCISDRTLLTASGRSRISWCDLPRTGVLPLRAPIALYWPSCTSPRASPSPAHGVSASAYLCPHRGTWWPGLGLHGPTRGPSPVPIPRECPAHTVRLELNRVQLQHYQYWTEWKDYFISPQRLPFCLCTAMFDFPTTAWHCWLNFNNPLIISCRTAI